MDVKLKTLWDKHILNIKYTMECKLTRWMGNYRKLNSDQIWLWRFFMKTE